MKISVIIVAAIILSIAFTAAATTYGTNEGSYKYGFNNAVSDFTNCYIGWTSSEGCFLNGHYEPIAECYVGAGPGIVTNSTACTNGYIIGWEHWCQKNTKDCVGLITKSDVFPGSLLSDNKTALSGLKALSYLVE